MSDRKQRNGYLVFVDTNVFLDFYRLRGDTATRQLAALTRHASRLILTEQVNMEYLKHRQRVIVETVAELKKPADQRLPPILASSEDGAKYVTQIKDLIASYGNIKSKVHSIISEPEEHDEVFRALEELFRLQSPNHLTRDRPEKARIRSLARKRFYMGYPPRKSNDTSIGDAINWEWMLHCMTHSEGDDLMIVSRDADYGSVMPGQDTLLNDWLAKEFKERIGEDRSIILTPRLSDALKKLNEKVSHDDIDEEQKIIDEVPSLAARLGLLSQQSLSAAISSFVKNNQKMEAFADLGDSLRLSGSLFHDLGKELAQVREATPAGENLRRADGIGVSSTPE